MQVQLKAWGNSQGVRIPQEIIRAAGIKINDTLDISTSQGKIVLCRPVRHQTLEERATAFGNRLLLDGEFDWGEPRGREVW